MTPRRVLAAAVAFALVVAGCSATGPSGADGSPSAGASSAAGACPATPEPDQGSIPEWGAAGQNPSIFPTIVSSSASIACGPNRLVFSFLNEANLPIAAPDRTASVAFYDLGADPATPVASGEGTFVWAIEDERGVYTVNVDLPTSGLYGAEFRAAAPGAAEETIRLQFDVQPTSTVVKVGDKAPSSDTPTLDDVDGDVARISTDSHPVDAFYETSVADAIAANVPFLLVFATPKFCASAQCGPTLDRIKPVAAAHPGFTVINVEPYQLQVVDGQLQPVTEGDPPNLVTTRATDEWRLLSEPWIFVVDGSGVVTSSFEGVASDAELEAAISAVE
jgi:hypothetical protein